MADETPLTVQNPTGTAKGGIVVVQEAFGVNDYVRSVVDRYAAAGARVFRTDRSGAVSVDFGQTRASGQLRRTPTTRNRSSYAISGLTVCSRLWEASTLR